MAASLTKPFLGAPHTSTGSLHSPSLLPSRNIIQLPARRSQLKRLGLTTRSPIKVYSETSQACGPSRACGLRPMQGGERSVDREPTVEVPDESRHETSQACLPRPSRSCCLRPIKHAERSVKLACGLLARNLLKDCVGTDILAYVSQVHKVVLPETLVDHETLTRDQIKGSAIRCPNPEYAEKMIAAIEAVRVRGDYVGGTVTCIVRNFPRSRGSRAFQEIAAVLARGVMAIPATKGFEICSEFTCTSMANSEYINESDQSCGMQGGIIKMRVAVMPLIPISRTKNTVSGDTSKEEEYRKWYQYFGAVPAVADLVEVMVAQELLCKLIAEGGKCLMSPTNAASQEPLESPESAKA